MMIKMRRSKGFTLVELLLVVAILAVLAFLAVPAIAETIRNSRMRTCASNEKMVEDAIWRYYADGIAAGKTLGTPVDLTGLTLGDADTLGTLVDAFNDGLAEDQWLTIYPYFTPGGVPKCPFGGTDTYLIEIVVSNNGLDDVLVICDDSEDGAAGEDGHPRTVDRRDEIEAETP